mmetsp:Transcript_37595/g.99361  ORF Transcript_37595/g.99361 Transcript_37595/m.99361 type:complete len:116 (+) Transcript_37595:717-1064(+)
MSSNAVVARSSWHLSREQRVCHSCAGGGSGGGTRGWAPLAAITFGLGAGGEAVGEPGSSRQQEQAFGLRRAGRGFLGHLCGVLAVQGAPGAKLRARAGWTMESGENEGQDAKYPA